MRRGFTAIVFGLGLAVSPVLAVPASEAAKSADASDTSATSATSAKKAGHGGSVAFWVAIGVAVFLAVQSARGRKTGVEKDEK